MSDRVRLLVDQTPKYREHAAWRLKIPRVGDSGSVIRKYGKAVVVKWDNETIMAVMPKDIETIRHEGMTQQ